jgi:hypothetical protein
MDLKLFGAVLWRFRVLVLAGVLTAFALAALTAVRLEFEGAKPGFSYRYPEIWESSSLLLLTQEGFPWGRSTLSEVVPLMRTGDGETQYAPRFADTPRYQGLAVLYAHLATSDGVRRIILADGPIDGEYGAEAVRASDGASYLPMISIKAYGPSPAAATQLANRATTAFRTYLDRYQAANDVPRPQRVEVPVVNEPRKATLFEGRSLTRPMFVLLLGLTLIIGLAFILENIRPRRSVRVLPPDQLALASSAERERDAVRPLG